MFEKDLPYIKPIFIGPNPQDRKIFMVDYDNKGYRGGTNTFKSEIKLDKTKEDDVFESFCEVLYSFDYGDYPTMFRNENIVSNSKFFYQLVKSGIDFLKQNAQIGDPTFIFIKEDYLKDKKIEKLVNTIDNVLIYDKNDIIIGRKNVDRNVEPGLYLSYNSFDNFSIDAIGHRAKNQYLILKIKNK